MTYSLFQSVPARIGPSHLNVHSTPMRTVLIRYDTTRVIEVPLFCNFSIFIKAPVASTPTAFVKAPPMP